MVASDYCKVDKENRLVKTLDCESIESTYKSLETILGIKESELRQLFDSGSFDEAKLESSCSSLLLSYVQKQTGCTTHFEEACFFHATRTWLSNTYEEGLLPTRQAEEKIVDFLLANGHAINKDQGNPMIRQSKWCYGGPFGFLIKEFAFVHNSKYVNYFDSPEIVDDNGLKELYQRITVPFIVKFVDQWTPKTKAWEQMKSLRAAILYAYYRHRHPDLELHHELLTYSFAGKNIPVSKQNILKIELV